MSNKAKKEPAVRDQAIDRRNLLLGTSTIVAAAALTSDALAQAQRPCRAPRRRASRSAMRWTRSRSALPATSEIDAGRQRCRRQSKIGKLDKAWDDAMAKGWTVVDMKQDWKTVFPEKP